MLKSIFEKNKNTVSDINQHLDTLVKYTSLCDSVCEMGVRGAVSTSAFLYALSLLGGTFNWSKIFILIK